jgi:LPXTG-motif cell wall-anchored protein
LPRTGASSSTPRLVLLGLGALVLGVLLGLVRRRLGAGAPSTGG